MVTKEEARLLARCEELLSRARGGEVTYTAFLTPLEQKRLATHFSFAAGEWQFEGGYSAAERRRMFFLPDYVASYEEPLRGELLREHYERTLVSLSVKGSGYEPLTHRDFLGAILHLGVERSAVGDVCVLSPQEAVLFCDRLMADFFTEHLTRVAGDAVRVSLVSLSPDFDGGRRFEPLTDTVASPRIDAVLAALCNLSREKARALLAEGRVELDYESEEKPDREVTEGAVITVRGHGKFRIRSLSDKTRKGRYWLLADRYI